jgi:hypothetical protein
MKALCFLVVFFCGCWIHPIPAPNPEPQPDRPATPTCADVCKRLFDLGCPAAKPTPQGATCVDVCLNVQNSGVVSWDLKCRARATSCAIFDRCP